MNQVQRRKEIFIHRKVEMAGFTPLAWGSAICRQMQHLCNRGTLHCNRGEQAPVVLRIRRIELKVIRFDLLEFRASTHHDARPIKMRHFLAHSCSQAKCVEKHHGAAKTRHWDGFDLPGPPKLLIEPARQGIFIFERQIYFFEDRVIAAGLERSPHLIPLYLPTGSLGKFASCQGNNKRRTNAEVTRHNLPDLTYQPDLLLAILSLWDKEDSQAFSSRKRISHGSRSAKGRNGSWNPVHNLLNLVCIEVRTANDDHFFFAARQGQPSIPDETRVAGIEPSIPDKCLSVCSIVE